MKSVVVGDVAKLDRTTATREECQTLPYLGLEHIEKETGHLITGFVPIPESLLASKFKFTPKHVLYGKLRPYLNKVIAPGFAGVCSTEMIPLLPGKKIIRDFLWVILLSRDFVAWADLNSTGANLPRLDPKKIATYRFFLPCPEEQERIVAAIMRVDRIRRLVEFAQRMEDELLAARFYQLFNAEANRFEIVELGDVLTSGPTNGIYKSAKDIGSGVQMLDIGSLYNGYTVDITSARRVMTSPKELDKYQVTSGDVLMNRVSKVAEGVGKAVLVDKISEATVYESNILKFGVNRAKLNPWFLVYYLSTPESRLELFSKANISNQASINQDAVKSLRVPLPPETLQNAFATEVASVERFRRKLGEMRRQVDHLFWTLVDAAAAPNATESVA